jgi:hypothetical protein
MQHSVSQMTLTSLSEIVGRPYVLHEGDLSKWSEDWKRQYVGRLFVRADVQA